MRMKTEGQEEGVRAGSDPFWLVTLFFRSSEWFSTFGIFSAVFFVAAVVAIGENHYARSQGASNRFAERKERRCASRKHGAAAQRVGSTRSPEESVIVFLDDRWSLVVLRRTLDRPELQELQAHERRSRFRTHPSRRRVSAEQFRCAASMGRKAC
jgi:hypothetical protein